MQKRSRYINRQDYNLLIMVLAIVASIAGYQSLGILADNVRANNELVWPINPDARVIEIERPVEKNDVKCNTEKCQIMAYIVEKFQDHADDAITILNKCENSSFNAKATNHNSNGTIDRGVFQINSIHGGDELYDWKTNVDVAHKIFKKAGNRWTPWACAEVVGQKPFWK